MAMGEPVSVEWTGEGLRFTGTTPNAIRSTRMAKTETTPTKNDLVCENTRDMGLLQQ